MLLFDEYGFRYKFRWCERKPKFLSLKNAEIITYEIIVSGKITLFYQRKDFKYVHFMHESDWYKIDAEKLGQAKELFYTAPNETSSINKAYRTSMVLYDENNNHYWVKWNINKPKYLTMKEFEIFQFEKSINNKKAIFYQRKDHKYVHFLYKNQWFKIKYEKVKNVHDFFDEKRLVVC